MNKVAAFALWRKNSILSMSEKMFCPPQPLRFWITPAYAGKRIKLRKRHSICGDHPRVCGEKKKAEEMGATTKGSPPRVQGKGGRTGSSGRYTGITPACAGKSWLRKRAPSTVWDPPRVCGEKLPYLPNGFRGWGSPPRVRGKAFQRVKILLNLGITPACAVKRFQFVLRLHAPGDYPRVCGEKTLSSVKSSGVSGSPPHVRGKGLEKLAHERRRGITPARAGKSTELRQRYGWCRDHPRVCGEKWKLVMVLSPQIGSPPRMRGKVRGGIDGIRLERITPACAGKSPAHPAACPVHQDHPRACGEKCPPGKFFFMTVGSPPRMRGKVAGNLEQGRVVGITPACAGKSQPVRP